MAVSGNGGAKLSAFARLYDKIILSHPRLVVPAYIAAIIFFGHHLKYFRLDASSDSIVLENDASLKYYEATRETFGSDDYILLAFTLESEPGPAKTPWCRIGQQHHQRPSVP